MVLSVPLQSPNTNDKYSDYKSMQELMRVANAQVRTEPATVVTPPIANIPANTTTTQQPGLLPPAYMPASRPAGLQAPEQQQSGLLTPTEISKLKSDIRMFRIVELKMIINRFNIRIRGSLKANMVQSIHEYISAMPATQLPAMQAAIEAAQRLHISVKSQSSK
jgi:hypothetical protein